MAWSMRRALTAGSILLAGVAGLAVVTAAQALEPGTTAAYEVLDCADFDGSIRVTATADADEPGPIEFRFFDDGAMYSESPDEYVPWLVAPGESRAIVIPDLPDGSRSIEVWAQLYVEYTGEPGDGSDPDPAYDPVTVLATEAYDVACDAVPTEPYTNPLAILMAPCRPYPGHLLASNRPIREQVELLTPVEFVVNAIEVSGAVRELDRFTLPALEGEDPYSHEADYPLLDGMGDEYVVEAVADGLVLASELFNPACEVSPAEPVLEGGPSLNGGGGHPQLPATGY